MKLKPIVKVEKRCPRLNGWMIAFLFLAAFFGYQSYFLASRWYACYRYMRMGYTKAVYNILIGGSPEQGMPINPKGPDNPNQYRVGDD